jgi:hypothetical protein
MASNIQGNINNILGQTSQIATLFALTPMGQELNARQNAKQEQAAELKNIQLAEEEFRLAEDEANKVTKKELAKYSNPTNMQKVHAYLGAHPESMDKMKDNIKQMKADYEKKYNPALYYKNLAARSLMQYKMELAEKQKKKGIDKAILNKYKNLKKLDDGTSIDLSQFKEER